MVRRRGDRGFRRVSLGRRARSRRRPHPRGRARTPRHLPHRARHHQRGVLRGAEGGSLHRHEQRRQRGARVPRAVDRTRSRRPLGVAATTCNYRDVIESDLIVLFGADVANAQPVFMKYLYLAKKRGAKVAVVNPLREPGLERYWVPSNVESAVFGTKVADEFFGVHTGGDVAFLNGVMKVLLADRRNRQATSSPSTRSGSTACSTSSRRSPSTGSRACRARHAPTWTRFAGMYAEAEAAVLVWSMGITQHTAGVDNVRAIVNLAPRAGNVGRAGRGLMPIRGHSGVQGGAEMGCYATAFPGGLPINAENAAALERAVGIRGAVDSRARRVGDGRGRAARRHRGAVVERRQLPRRAARARRRPAPRWRARRCACTRTSCSASQMLVEAGDTVVLLPAATRYEQDGRRHVDHDRAAGRVRSRARGASGRRGAQRVPDLPRRRPARRSRAGGAARLCIGARRSATRSRASCRATPGSKTSTPLGDTIQVGGARLCEGGVFPTA